MHLHSSFARGRRIALFRLKIGNGTQVKSDQTRKQGLPKQCQSFGDLRNSGALNFENFDFIHEAQHLASAILDTCFPIAEMRTDFHFSFTAPVSFPE